MTTETITAFYARRAEIQSSGTPEEPEALAAIQTLIRQMPDFLAVFGEMPLVHGIVEELAPDSDWPEGLPIQEAQRITAFEAAAEAAAQEQGEVEDELPF